MKDAEAIASGRKQHIDAFNRIDIEDMASVVTDDVVVMAPNFPPVVGKAAARSWWKQGFAAGASHFGFSPTELEVAGTLAYDRFAWSMETKTSPDAEATRDHGDCVWIWRKGPDGSWRIARAIWNSDNEVTGVWSGASRT